VHPTNKVPQVRLQESPNWPDYLVGCVGSVWGVLIIAGVVPFLTFFMLWHKRRYLSGSSGLLNLLPFLGLIFSLALPLSAALLQFNTPGPYIVITLTILFLHVVSANPLTPKFIANRVIIGPVAARLGFSSGAGFGV
jgi:predicted PurR-regulated permease PerM